MDIPEEQTDGQMAIRQDTNQQNNGVVTEGKSYQQQTKEERRIW
jgi:hypothetical protein